MRATRATRRDDPERLRQGLLPELLALHPQVPPVQDGRWQRLTKLGLDAQRNLFAVLGTPEERVARLGCILNNSQSQFREDLLLLPLLLGLALGRAGRFVEAGALDGLDISNTLVLERCFGWTGLLIEASPSNFAQLRRSGRSATMVHAALCADGTVVNVADGAATNGLRQRSAGGAEAHVVPQGGDGAVSVPCRGLGRMQAELGLPAAPDFLSLDVEGSEAAALATVDASGIGVVLVEMHGRRGASQEASRLNAEGVHERLTSAGLQRCSAFRIYWSAVYLRAGLCPRSPRMRVEKWPCNPTRCNTTLTA
jgi:FkbM family methyltransferase